MSIHKPSVYSELWPKKTIAAELNQETTAPISEKTRQITGEFKEQVGNRNVQKLSREAYSLMEKDEITLKTYFSIFWITEQTNNPQERKLKLGDLRSAVENLASYYISDDLSLQKIDYNTRRERFLKDIEPTRLASIVKSVDLSVDLSIPFSFGWLSEISSDEQDALNVSKNPIDVKKIEAAQREMYVSTLKAGHENTVHTAEVWIDAKDRTETKRNLDRVYAEFDAKSHSTWDRDISQKIREKVAINDKWDLTLLEPIKFWDWEITLTPDGKWIELRWHSYEYKFSKFDWDSLEAAMNKISSLTFLENTWLTSLAPQELKSICTNLNWYFSVTKWVPLNMDKKEWFTAAEKIELLAIFKKLNVIPSYDPNNLSKRIIDKETVANNLIYNTWFYKWKWQFDLTAFDTTIKKMISKSETQTA